MVVWGGNHRLLPLHSGADSSLETLGRDFEASGGEAVRPRRAARKARRGMAASLMRERRRVSGSSIFKSWPSIGNTLFLTLIF